MKYLIIILAWSAYCFLHSFLISIKFTNFLSRLLKNYYAFFRIFYNLFSLFLLILLIKYTDSLGTDFTLTLSPPLTITRYIITAGALIIFFWAFFFDYDSLSFFGFRQIMNFGKTKEINPDEEIKKKGFLGIVRHPMYFALIIFLLVNVNSDVDIIVNSVLIIYVIIGTIVEEKKLVLEFGNTYVRYQEEVPMLIPFTKRKK